MTSARRSSAGPRLSTDLAIRASTDVPPCNAAPVCNGPASLLSPRVRGQRPLPTLTTRHIVAIVLIGVPIDERTAKQRVPHAAHFVFDRKEDFARRRVDDVLEAVLMLVTLLN